MEVCGYSKAAPMPPMVDKPEHLDYREQLRAAGFTAGEHAAAPPPSLMARLQGELSP